MVWSESHVVVYRPRGQKGHHPCDYDPIELEHEQPDVSDCLLSESRITPRGQKCVDTTEPLPRGVVLHPFCTVCLLHWLHPDLLFSIQNGTENYRLPVCLQDKPNSLRLSGNQMICSNCGKSFRAFIQRYVNLPFIVWIFIKLSNVK